jgi:hypothetical protein
MFKGGVEMEMPVPKELVVQEDLRELETLVIQEEVVAEAVVAEVD